MKCFRKTLKPLRNSTAEDENTILPNFTLGEAFNSNDVQILEKQTTPKSRFTEASIIKAMEESGIGRPSTYSQTINTLKERKYVTLHAICIIFLSKILPTGPTWLTNILNLCPYS